MTSYKTAKALSPISPDLISREQVERIFELGKKGKSVGQRAQYLTCNHEEIADYKGYFLPRSIFFARAGRRKPAYALVLIGEELDARVQRADDSESPWLLPDTPDIAQIEAFWEPVIDRKTIADIVSIFRTLDENAASIAASLAASEPTLENKQAAIKTPDVDLSTLSAFCQLIGRETEATDDYIKAHVIPSAQTPLAYLEQHGRLEKMSVGACREFSWHQALSDTRGYFFTSNYLTELDWKVESDDVAYAINAMLEERGTAAKITLARGDETYLTDDWLKLAAQELDPMGFAIATINCGGDSYIFTVLKNDKVQSFYELGDALKIDVDVLGRKNQKKQPWFRRLFGS